MLNLTLSNMQLMGTLTPRHTGGEKRGIGGLGHSVLSCLFVNLFVRHYFYVNIVRKL